MPTVAEVKAQLTAPGGPFEITTDVVGGVEVQVYKDRFPTLRSVPEMAALRGEQPFLLYGEDEWSYGRFCETINRVGHGFVDAGIGHGDRIAVLSQNNPEWCLSFWGAVTGGAILVGLNGWWKAEEVVYGLQDSGSRILVADRKRFERIADLLDECPDLERIYLTSDADVADFVDVVGPAHADKLRPFSELIENADATPLDNPIEEDDTAVIFYSSGTTGKPKGIMSTHRNMVANMQNTVLNTMAGAMAATDGAEDPLAGSSGQTVSLFTSPLFHVSGCHSTLVVGMLGGVKLVMPVGRFTPEDALQTIQDQKVNIWATVPTMIWRVCEHPDRHSYDTSTVRTVAFGGSPSAEELQRKISDTFPNVNSTSNAYGLTESSSVATVNSGEDAKRKPDSVGPPVPTVEIQVIDHLGTPVPTGEVGEICIKGPIIMAGYWNKPEATAETLVEGWLRTGDIGYVDDEGFVFITDRKKDMIIRGGENIYCVEIEERLVNHPEIADAAVYGVPHAGLGEEVKATVQVEEGSSLDEAAVRQWVAEALADFKVPAYVDLTNNKLPRNASGKLLKNVLRGEGVVSFEETM